MDEERLYRILHPETRDPAARIFRGLHHAMVAAGIGIMLADTVVRWREAYEAALDAGFQIVCAFFFTEYVLRLVSGILVFALWAGILAMGFAEETRRREFLRTWDLVAKVPFFHDVGAAAIAYVAQLLRPRDYPAGAVVVRRGERGDCMYFVASGEVEIRLRPESIRLAPGDFFGELALLTGDPRNATIVAVRQSTLLRLDIVDFRHLLGRQPELARIIRAAAEQRLEAATL